MAGTRKPPGGDSTRCSIAANEDGSFTLSCQDGTRVLFRDDDDQATGVSCDIVDNEDETFSIQCDDGTHLVLQGGDSSPPPPHTGVGTCTIADNADGSRTLSCDDGTELPVGGGTNGPVGNSCAAADNGDGTFTRTTWSSQRTFFEVSDPKPIFNHYRFEFNGSGSMTVAELEFYWIPSFGDAGEYLVTFEVSDGEYAVYQDVLITVNKVYPVDLIDDMIDDIHQIDLPDGIRDNVLSRPNNASNTLSRGNTKAGINQLNALLNFVDAQTGKQIPLESAQVLRELIQTIIICAMQP